MSLTTPVAYIEAEFFGGLGGQSAVVWSGGSEIMAPIHAPNAIDQALRLQGVLAGDAYDAFAALGLGRHRNTHDWFA
jgi:hypothetical protein